MKHSKKKSVRTRFNNRQAGDTNEVTNKNLVQDSDSATTSYSVSDSARDQTKNSQLEIQLVQSVLDLLPDTNVDLIKVRI
jgi:hypothetical protein